MLQHYLHLDLLMSLKLNLNVKLVIFLKLPHYLLLPSSHNNLDFIFICIGSVSIPVDFLNQIVLWHIYSRTSEADSDDKPFSIYLLSSMVQV